MLWRARAFGEFEEVSAMIYGYIMATQEEMEHRIHDMSHLGVERKNIYADLRQEKTSSTTAANRPSYMALLEVLRAGDTVYFGNLADLGYGPEDILEQWIALTKKAGADVAVLTMPLLDTRWRRELVGSYVSDMFVTIFSYLADKRKAIRQHQKEAFEEARKKGVKLGAPKKPLPFNFPIVYEDYVNGKISLREGARRCGMAHNTFQRKVMEYKP